MADLSVRSRGVFDAIQGVPDEEKPALLQKVAEANPGWLPQSDASKTRIWVTLLAGLFVIALTAVVGAVVVALQSKDAASLFVLATAIVSGTIGLFSKSPIA